LIEKNGRTVTVRRLENDPADPLKPWEGPTDPVDPLQGSVTAKAVIVADKARAGVEWSRMSKLMDDVKSPAQVCLFAAANDNGLDLLEFDQVVDGSTVYRIHRSELLAPGDVKLLYVFEIMR
jgi:hypothetical protein